MVGGEQPMATMHRHGRRRRRRRRRHDNDDIQGQVDYVAEWLCGWVAREVMSWSAATALTLREIVMATSPSPSSSRSSSAPDQKAESRPHSGSLE